jgi:hypothetical protein
MIEVLFLYKTVSYEEFDGCNMNLDFISEEHIYMMMQIMSNGLSPVFNYDLSVNVSPLNTFHVNLGQFPYQ